MNIISMMNIKNKDLVALGIIIGIALFFIGAIIINVFPSSESNIFSYKVSACVKLVGLGFLTNAMVIGGIILGEDINKNLKLLLLLLGLILLIIYTIGSQSLQWDVNVSGLVGSSEAYESRPTGYGIPGFETVLIMIGIIVTLLVMQVKRTWVK
ncbi:MAG: hypothetical protein QXS02_03680 [Candidatus Thermoplasmatota archaeon]